MFILRGRFCIPITETANRIHDTMASPEGQSLTIRRERKLPQTQAEPGNQAFTLILLLPPSAESGVLHHAAEEI
jgi:hypothetical protein